MDVLNILSRLSATGKRSKRNEKAEASLSFQETDRVSVPSGSVKMSAVQGCIIYIMLHWDWKKALEK